MQETERHGPDPEDGRLAGGSRQSLYPHSAMWDSTYSVHGKFAPGVPEEVLLTANAGPYCSYACQPEQSTSRSLNPWTPQVSLMPSVDSLQ